MSEFSPVLASLDAMRPGLGAGAAPERMVLLDWEHRPCESALHNLRRARTALRARQGPVLLRRRPSLPARPHALFPGDFSPSSLARLDLAMRTLPHARFTLLHACRACGDGYLQAAGVAEDAVEACRRGAERRARQAARHVARQASHAGLRFAVEALRAPWADAVARHAWRAEADLLVLAGSGGGWLTRRLYQARLCALLSQTGCDVLLLPPQ